MLMFSHFLSSPPKLKFATTINFKRSKKKLFHTQFELHREGINYEKLSAKVFPFSAKMFYVSSNILISKLE
jgi:hypothetical protein